jgi:DNA-binding ferritin-like protein
MQVEERASDAFAPTTDLNHEAIAAITSALRPLLAGVFALYMKTKNSHRLQDNNAADVTPQDMLAELCADNQQLTRFLRATHAVCDASQDVATAGVIEIWLDDTERRTWT